MRGQIDFDELPAIEMIEPEEMKAPEMRTIERKGLSLRTKIGAVVLAAAVGLGSLSAYMFERGQASQRAQIVQLKNDNNLLTQENFVNQGDAKMYMGSAEANEARGNALNCLSSGQEMAWLKGHVDIYTDGVLDRTVTNPIIFDTNYAQHTMITGGNDGWRAIISRSRNDKIGWDDGLVADVRDADQASYIFYDDNGAVLDDSQLWTSQTDLELSVMHISQASGANPDQLTTADGITVGVTS